LLLSTFELQAVGDRTFNSVTQGVVGVVGGVRTDEHIRQFVQPQQGLAFDGFVSAVGVEYSFLSFEDIQRRTAQSAAFQRWNKGLGIEESTASSVDNERTVLHLPDTSTIQEMVCIRVERRMERYDVALP
jgi:hypothetical protein